MKEWVNLPQEELRNSIKQFRTRLRDVIKKKEVILNKLCYMHFVTILVLSFHNFNEITSLDTE